MLKRKDTLIQFEKVNFGYEPQKPILKGVSFSIKKNEYVCVVGANACGKSTLVKLMVGLFKPHSGSIIFKGKTITKENVKDLKYASGIVFENPDNQFIGLTVQDEIAFGLENRCVPRNQMQSIIEKTASLVGISNLLKAGTKNLSGGEKQLVALASVLATNPELIIFDEATSMLDTDNKNKINNLILSLNKKYKKTIVRITHDMEEANKADKIIVVNNGRIVLTGTPKEIFNSKQLKSLSLDKPFVYKLQDKLGTNFVQRINYEK